VSCPRQVRGIGAARKGHNHPAHTPQRIDQSFLFACQQIADVQSELTARE